MESFAAQQVVINILGYASNFLIVEIPVFVNKMMGVFNVIFGNKNPFFLKCSPVFSKIFDDISTCCFVRACMDPECFIGSLSCLEPIH